MKKILILIFSLLFYFGYSQNKTETNTKKPSLEETQKWIKQKIEDYANVDKDVFYKHEVQFNNSIMEIEITLTYSTGIESNTISFDVKDVENISVIEKYYNVWLEIIIKEGGKINCLYEPKSKDNKVSVLLNKSFLENNLPERFKKAFNNLIELNGGTPINYKESF